MTKLKIGFSPCPNDTFIFDAIVNKKIDTEEMEFKSVIEDVETLNKKALSGELEVTKLSFQTYLNIKDKYALLNSGSALGRNCGPILISNRRISSQELKFLKVLIPGKNTTANLLLTLAFPEIVNKKEILFSQIEDAILKGKADAGLIIHESRFTYREKGLIKIIDLGEYWEKITGCALPLGCIAIRKNVSEVTRQKMSRVMRKSVEFALENRNSSFDFVKAHSQELSVDVINKHIDLYVNEFTLDLGIEGHKAIDSLEAYLKRIRVIESGKMKSTIS